jgi:hypothetical protein
MLDDLRQLMKQSWRQRARVYLVTAGALTLAMTAFGFDPVGQAAGGSSLWLAFAAGVLALVSRAMLPAATAVTEKPAAPAETKIDRHTHDLESRNLQARRA